MAPAWAQAPFQFGRNSYPETDTIRNNIIWNSAPGASPADRVMLISADASPGGKGSGSYDFNQFQAFNANFASNRYADPKFKNASPALTLTPGAFNFDLQPTATAISRNSAADRAGDNRSASSSLPGLKNWRPLLHLSHDDFGTINGPRSKAWVGSSRHRNDELKIVGARHLSMPMTAALTEADIKFLWAQKKIVGRHRGWVNHTALATNLARSLWC